MIQDRSDLVPYGEALIRSGEPTAGAYLLERADPTAGDARLTPLICRCLLQAGAPAKAVERLERGASSRGWDPETWHLYAVALAAAGRLDEAIEVAEVAAREPTVRVKAGCLLADLHLRAGHAAAARHAAEAAVGEAPDEADGYLALARVAQAEGLIDERLALLERASTLAPEDPKVRTALGAAYVDAGRRHEGQRVLGAVVAAHPGDLSAAQALVRSPIRSMRLRRVSGLAILFASLAIALLSALLVTLLGLGDPSSGVLVYFVSVFGLGVGLRVLDRQRTDPSVRRIRAHAYRRLRALARRSSPPIGNWAAWSVIVIGGLILLAGVMGLVIPDPQRTKDAVSSTLWVIAFGAALTLVGVGFLPKTKKRRGWTHRIATSSCHCAETARITGPQAMKYATRHLREPFALTGDGILRLRCELLRYGWLLFPRQAGPSAEPLPLLLRLPPEVDATTPELAEPGTGFYL